MKKGLVLGACGLAGILVVAGMQTGCREAEIQEALERNKAETRRIEAQQPRYIEGIVKGERYISKGDGEYHFSVETTNEIINLVSPYEGSAFLDAIIAPRDRVRVQLENNIRHGVAHEGVFLVDLEAKYHNEFIIHADKILEVNGKTISKKE